jgi:hypothetical protein
MLGTTPKYIQHLRLDVNGNKFIIQSRLNELLFRLLQPPGVW